MPTVQRRAHRQNRSAQQPLRDLREALWPQLDAIGYLTDAFYDATVLKPEQLNAERKMINQTRIVIGNVTVPRQNEAAVLHDCQKAAIEIGLALRLQGMTPNEIQQLMTGQFARTGTAQRPGQIEKFPAAVNQ